MRWAKDKRFFLRFTVFLALKGEAISPKRRGNIS